MAKRAASRTQIPSLAAKRPRRALEAPPDLPRASGQIQSRGVKRACSVTAQTSCSWGAKRARTARSGTPGLWCCVPCHSCCLEAGQIQYPGAKGKKIRSPGVKQRNRLLRASSVSTQTSCSWGAKRARSGTRGPWCRSVCVPGHSCCLEAGQIRYPGAKGRIPPKALNGPRSRRERRDWANLGDGPAGLIAELVLANDVADYVRFRAVCRPWRRCSADPCSGSSLDGRFLPRKWTMLDKAHAGPCRRRFLNISTGECIRTDLPELASGHRLLAVTPEGLLLLVHERTLVARLLNPLTRQLTDLPPVTALLRREQLRAWRSGCASAGDIIGVGGVGIADASAVAVYLSYPRAVAVARPGDGCWTVVDANRHVDSALSCAGRFYCASGNSVMVLDTSGSDGQPPRLRPVAVASFFFSRMSATLHLIDNAGELMLVHRTLHRDTAAQTAYKRRYDVSRVDLDAGATVPAKDLGGRSVLLSMGRTISVPAGAFPSITADTIYFGFDCDEKQETMLNQIDAYNVADGSSQPCHHLGIVQPWNAVDCLAYCIQGNGDHLA